MNDSAEHPSDPSEETILHHAPAPEVAVPEEGDTQAARPASRPLTWPPARYREAPSGDEEDDGKNFRMLRVPVGEARPGDEGIKHAVTFTAAGAAPDVFPEAPSEIRSEIKTDDAAGAVPPPSVSSAVVPDQAKNALIDTAYVLGPGDRIKITIFGEPDLSGEFIVNDAGQISYPLVGEVPLQGLTLMQTKDKIAALLKNGYMNDPSISIEVAAFRPFYITGEVRSPGSYAYVAGMSVMNAVVVAGGFTFRADQDEVGILRTTVDGTKMLKDMDTDEKVVPGDIILVEERFF